VTGSTREFVLFAVAFVLGFVAILVNGLPALAAALS
jgi:hypothetical protein